MSSMGMDKSGTQAIAQNAWVKLTSFVVRSGYPDTVISNNTLVMNAPGVGDITCTITYGLTGDTQQCRVVRNGSEVLGGPFNQGVTGTIPGVAVAAGDTIELQAFTNSAFTARRNVSGGFVAFDQTTQDHPAAGAPEIGWYTSTTAGVGRNIDPDETEIGWDTTAIAGLESPADIDTEIGWSTSVEARVGDNDPIDAEETEINWNVTAETAHGKAYFGDVETEIGWSTSADTFHGRAYFGDVETEIGWAVEADLLHLRKPSAPRVLWEVTSVSIHTGDGRVLGSLLCDQMDSVVWTRERREVSGCEITALTQADPELMEDIRPWVHWVTVWHDDRPVWSGPIQQATIGRSTTRLVTKDPATFMWRTRIPVTYAWADTDPSSIAASVIRSMNDLHRLTANPIVLPSVTEAFTYQAVADSRMLHQMMDDLTKLGLEWTVVAGRFVLGRFPTAPVAELAECDFLVEIERLRDGTSTFNDVRVQGQNWAQNATVPLAGLRLQTLVSIDDVFGVSNIQKAARLYAAEVAAIRDVLVLPSGASLHPEADVTFDDLIPGKVFKVQAAGISNLMVLDQMRVSVTPSSFDIQVTLEAIQDNSELAELVQGV